MKGSLLLILAGVICYIYLIWTQPISIRDVFLCIGFLAMGWGGILFGKEYS